MASTRRSPDEWRDLIGRWQQSGQSAKEFCATQGIGLAQFYKRRADLRTDVTDNRFVPVRVRTDAIVVQIGELSVRCSSDTPVSWLADLARALR